MKTPFLITYRDMTKKSSESCVRYYANWGIAVDMARELCNEKGYYLKTVAHYTPPEDDELAEKTETLIGCLNSPIDGQVWGYINEMGEPTKEVDFKTLQTLCCSGGLPLLFEVKL